MGRRKSGYGVSLALLAAGCAAGPKLSFDYDRDANFTGYRSYAWAAIAKRARNPIVHEIIVHGIDEQLVKKGLARVDSSAAEALVTYHGSASEETVLDTDFYGYGYGPGWSAGGAPEASKPVTTFARRTLIVDLWDARTKRLVWRGIATDIVSDDPAVNAEKVRVAVEELFARYPPGAGK